MELKTNDTPDASTYSSENNEDSTYSNPNDALFGDLSNDAYVITNTAQPKKKASFTPIHGALIGVIVAVLIFGFKYWNEHKYDGTYKLTKTATMGVEYDIDDVLALAEAQMGMELTMEIEFIIDGNTCTADIDILGQQTSGSLPIKWKDNSFSISSGTETIYCEYDKDRDAIVIERDGTMLILEKQD